jgi:hypothetical protein
MGETTIFLEWDGICCDTGRDPPTPETVALWCNYGRHPKADKPPEPRGPMPASATISPEPSQGPVLAAQRAEVVLVGVSKPFAPMQEYCHIEISVKNIERAGTLVLQIRDADGALVHAERLDRKTIWGLAHEATRPASSAPPLAWKPGEDPALRAKRKGLKWATPHGSPYTVTVWISPQGDDDIMRRYDIGLAQTEERNETTKNTVKALDGASADAAKAVAEAHVRYHSIGLELMPWESLYKAASKQSDLARPGSAGKQQTMWVQYKLNELGFPAGPIDGALTDELKKAIRRFRQASKVLYRRPWQPSPDFETIQEKPGVLDGLGAIDGPLLDELEKGTPKRVLVDPGVIAAPGAKAKVFVDQDRHYLTVDEMDNEPRLAATTIKNTVEKAWLNRPLLPIKATIYLQSANGDKILAPAAVGDVKVRWSWQDGALADDEGGAGKLPANTRDQPSQTAVYVPLALTRCRDKVRSKYKNTRAVVGGLVTGADDDARVVFRELPESVLPISVVKDGLAATPAYTVFDEREPLLGGSALLFSPSVIAGDCYQVGAALEVAGSRADKILAAMKPAETTTGWMTVWRRLRVAAHVSWPPPAGSITAMWDEVRREYQDAFVELNGPDLYKATSSFPADFGTRFDTAVQRVLPELKEKYPYFKSSEAYKGFLATAYFSGDPPVKGMSTTSADKINKAVKDLLEPEVTGPKPGDDPPRLKAFKKWVADWPTLDKGVSDYGIAALSTVGKDAYLADASTHYVNLNLWEEVQLGGLKTFFKPLSTVVGDKALAPWKPADDWVAASQDKSAYTVDELTRRVSALLDPELTARHATDENTDMPRVNAFANATGISKGFGGWQAGNDVTFGFGDVKKSPEKKGDPFLKAAFTHYKAELSRLTEKRNLGQEKRVLRYKRVAMPPAYAPSRELAERIADSLREGVTEPVTNFIKKTQVMLLGELEEAVFRATDPGILMLDFKPHREVPLASADGSTESFLAKIFAMANGNGLVIIDQSHMQVYKWYHLYTHEIGHCQFLKHWKNASGFEAMDHDHADDNCHMSYSTEKHPEGTIVGDGAHYALGRYAPHFCGKCNLKLRGWDLRAKSSERDGKGEPVDLLPVTSDPSKTVKVIDYLDPVFPYTPMSKAKIPSPNLLEASCTEMMAQMLEVDASTAAGYWLNKRVNEPGVVRVIANPKLVMRGARATFEWEAVPMETVPEGTPWQPPPGVGRIFDGKDKQAWIDDLEYYTLIGGLTAANEAKVELNGLFHYCDFTDLIHETWHLVQKMGGEAPLYEGVTDLFADMLGRRVASKASASKGRFAYQFNPSYSESVLSVIDMWLPQLGLQNLADVYIKDAKHLDEGVTDKARLVSSLTNSTGWAARKLFKKQPNDDAPIRNDQRELRVDIVEAIEDAATELQDELRASIHAFLDFLVAVESTLTGPQKLEVAKYTGTQKFYVIAKLARRVRKQYAFTRALRVAQQFKRDADAAGKQLRDFEKQFAPYLATELMRLNNDPRLDPSDEIEDSSPANATYRS